MRVALRRSGNVCAVVPTTDQIERVIAPLMSYIETVYYRGQAAAMRRRQGLSLVEEIPWELFDYDFRKRLCFPYGFADRIYEALQEAGYDVRLRWASEEDELKAAAKEAIYTPDWSRVEDLLKSGFTFRWRQRECLEVVAANENARIDAPTGFGKAEIIMLYCLLFPRAKIAVAVDSVEIAKNRLFPCLSANIPGVGLYGGGVRKEGRRINIYTADSLHHAGHDNDTLIVDEVHMACADKFASSIMERFADARKYGFSATHDMRLDNKDLRAEAMFGPIRFHMPYQEAVEHDLVVPIEVIWSNVIMDENPCAELKDVEKKRKAYWSNEHRNHKIAKDVALYGDDAQGLITVETIEHALYLHKLTGIEMIYAGQQMTFADIKYYRDMDLLPSSFKVMTEERRAKLTKWFTKGTLRKAIATSVFNFGVDFRHLRVLLRADGGASPINDTQIPGRNSRHALKGVKFVGIVHDYMDQFDWGCGERSKKRQRSYASHGWMQHYPQNMSAKKALIHKLMHEGPTP